MVQAKTLKCVARSSGSRNFERGRAAKKLRNRHNRHICQVCPVHNDLWFDDLILLYTDQRTTSHTQTHIILQLNILKIMGQSNRCKHCKLNAYIDLNRPTEHQKTQTK